MDSNHQFLIRDCSRHFILWFSDSAKYNRILNNREYFRSKGVDSELVFMPPEEYLNKCAKGFGVSLQRSNEMIDPKKVEKYKNMLSSGHKFPCPILSYNKASHSFLQEGRHRAQACKELGISPIPVWIITSNSDVNNKIDEIPMLSNNQMNLSKLASIWKPADKYRDNPGFIRNWNFVSPSKAQELLGLVNSIE